MVKGRRVKICGITSVEDAQTAVGLGADMIGINFHRSSPRYVDVPSAGKILACLPDTVAAIAVVVSPLPTQLEEFNKLLPRIDLFQIYRDAWPATATIKWPSIPSFAVRDASDLRTIQETVAVGREHGEVIDAILLDAYHPGLYGGTGTTAPWETIAGIDVSVPIILAGGLTPENVARAIQIVRPQAVDVAGGIEESPGRKSHEKMRRFIEEARNAFEAEVPSGLR
jgi:phosphoribosylanthranilate isomerase